MDGVTRTDRWLARGSLIAVAGAAAVLLVFGGLHTLTLLIVVVCAAVAETASLFWFLTSRGSTRWIALGVLLVIPVVVFVFLVLADLWWVVVVAAALAALAVVCARLALHRSRATESPPPPQSVPAPKHPFLVMNPRSGGGKVVKFDLKNKAEALGAEVVLLEGDTDVAGLAREAIGRGADLLGVAGGDGTQASVAGVAAAHDLPFLVISAGTRNHFASDLGLDLVDPTRCLDALTDGIETRVDLGDLDGRPFVNNVSFGAYAQIVQNPAYRDDKAGTVLQTLPDVLKGHSGPRIRARIGDVTIDDPQAVLVSNNPYEMHDLVGLGHRQRVDRGTLGVVAISVSSTRQAVGLLRRTHQHGLVQGTGREVVIEADEPQIPVAVDGEALIVSTPIHCTIAPGALRVRLPRVRPGIGPQPTPVDWVRLRRLAAPVKRGS